MWKRWSFNAFTPETSSGGDKTNPSPPATTAKTAAGPASALDPSAKPETVAEDTAGEGTSLEVADDPEPVDQPTGENAVAPDTPTSPTPITAPDASIKEDPTSESNDSKLSTEPNDGTSQKGPSPPYVGSSTEDPAKIPIAHDSGLLAPASAVEVAEGVSSDAASASTNTPTGDETIDSAVPADTLPVPQQEKPSLGVRRLSFRSFAFFYGRDESSTTRPASPSPKGAPAEPVRTKPHHPPKPKLSRSEKKALSSALALRTLIVGPGPVPSNGKHVHNKLSHLPPPADLQKAKSHLLKPKKANAVIAQLRRMPLPDGPTVHASKNASSESLVTHPDAGGTPIHAVCLAVTDEEAGRLYFSRLRASHAKTLSPLPQSNDARSAGGASSLLSVGTASLESLLSVLKDLQLVSLLESPDLGFGQPVSEVGTGPLTGSVPSAEAIVGGFEEITKQLMTLGFATSKAVFPSHTGIYPPEDRMSVLTYWWGLELVMPEPSVKYLGKVKSISHAVLNFLSAVALFNNGVREVLPFIRYIANFVDFEWGAIQSQDRGRGVVCAATWVMPAAMVPRPWDFPPRPIVKSGPANVPASTTPTALKPTPSPAPVPRNDADDNDKTSVPSPPPPQESVPNAPSSMPYPPAPMIPMLPTLMVTPATLPRAANPPQQEVSA